MTDRTTRFVLLCSNAVFFLVAVVCILASVLAQMGARGCVTALDRANAFDVSKVATVAPACVMPATATSPAMINRTALGDWIAEQDQYMAGVTSKLFALMAFANLVICVLLLRRPVSSSATPIPHAAYAQP